MASFGREKIGFGQKSSVHLILLLVGVVKVSVASNMKKELTSYEKERKNVSYIEMFLMPIETG